MATKIAWTERTWNPIAGCTVISPGCTNCYAMRRARRIEAQQHGAGKYAGLTRPSSAGPVWTGELRLWDPAIHQPLRWPASLVFVNSMSDLAHEDMPTDWFRRIWQAMVESQTGRGHVFQVLTKRPRNLVRLLKAIGVHDPIPGIWLGVSAEDQRRWDERVPILRDIPTLVPWVSVEPQLGPIERDPDQLAWVVQGGESGSRDRVRGFDMAWARDMRDRCRATGSAYFLKQIGAVTTMGDHDYPHKSKAGTDPAEWPADLRIQQYPSKLRLITRPGAVS